MFQEIKDYTKCAIRNKPVLIGYVGLGLSLLAKYIKDETGIEMPVINDVVYYTSWGLLILAKFGKGTYKSYRKMRKHISECGTIKPSFKNKFSSMYCVQLGIKMAAEESGLEHLLKDNKK